MMSETWLHNMISNNLVSIPGCAIYRHDRQSVRDDLPNVTKKGGGLAVYVIDVYM